MAVVKKFRIISYKKEKSFISLENISVSFKKNHQILDNVSLNIPKGQILGLLGPNGAGKSTLMNVISGLIKPSYGKVKINNEDISDLPIYIRTKKIQTLLSFADKTFDSEIHQLASLIGAYRLIDSNYVLKRHPMEWFDNYNLFSVFTNLISVVGSKVNNL